MQTIIKYEYKTCVIQASFEYKLLVPVTQTLVDYFFKIRTRIRIKILLKIIVHFTYTQYVFTVCFYY